MRRDPLIQHGGVEAQLLRAASRDFWRGDPVLRDRSGAGGEDFQSHSQGPAATDPAELTPFAHASLVDQDPGLVRPLAVSVYEPHTASSARQHIHLAQKLYTFWDTGSAGYLYEALGASPDENPVGSGWTGLLVALRTSQALRAAVPDLRCELSELLVLGDKLASRLRFRGHFDGVLHGVHGVGQTVNFIAFDIRYVDGSALVQEGYLETRLSLLTGARLPGVTGQAGDDDNEWCCVAGADRSRDGR
jgi:predicted ester cyclase